ncbi:MAG: UDP-2,3-diacylglucosamine diphosphatase LpxI [Gemmataceae bacterium]
MSAALASIVDAPRRPNEPIGLLAGAGRFPIAFAQKANQEGRRVACVALRGMADPELAGLVWRFHWTSPTRLGRMIGLFRGDGARQVVMAGKVYKNDLMYQPWKLLTLVPDWRTIRWWYFGRRRDNKDDTLLLSVIAEFARDGLTFASALDLCPELLVKPGVLTRRKPTTAETTDIQFGWALAREMGRLDVGQSVAVKDRACLAVEAIEGTDRAILRAGELCRAGGFTVIKVAKPEQDMRFDVPTVGVTTIETMHRAGGRVLAIEAGRTILLDHPDTVALADRLGISIIALAD